MNGFVDQINGAARKVPAWPIYVVGILPVPWLLYLGMTGGLGREPIKALEQELGAIALQLLIATLCITPLRRYLRLNLLKFRRALGLLVFVYVSLHFLVWAVLDVQSIDRVWTDIVKRPYVTIGMAGYLLLLPLALTSNNWSVWKLGPMWRSLHKLSYVIVLLGAVHFIWLTKGFQLEPLVYTMIILGLLALRMVPNRRVARA